ncbi:chlorophyllase-2-like [Lolium rigidum]|uniref:chlorophyllase-2-like n=1 Tax=Lolium rigidum TaxID=89674 RepID=UPI001F5C853A|nr:chlorophyllase-2-like [Lolium rigidum]
MAASARFTALAYFYCLLLLTMASAGDVFDHGRHGTSLSQVQEAKTSRCSPASVAGPPKPLLIAAPSDAGEYPVVVFLHGYLANNYFYSQLLQHVASHGFIVVAPQLYTFSGPDTTGEISSAAAVIDWLADGGLSSSLPPNVRPNLTAVSISGHSRGGKVAFALALGHARTSLPLAALIAVDPVDGMAPGRQTPPPILTYRETSLRVPGPVMVIGTGLGALRPPCAPLGVSHAEFYRECAAPACHLVARDYGHTDMMDDVTGGAKGLCKSGGARAPMRRFVGGAMVAFLEKWVEGRPEWLDGIRERPEVAPVVLSAVEFRDAGTRIHGVMLPA